MTELEKFLTSLYDAVLQAEVAAQSHGQAAYTLLQASPSQRDSRIPVYHATNISIDLDVGLEAREENGVTRMYVTDRPEDETAISFDLEVYDFIEPGDQPDLGDLPVEGGEGEYPFARPDIGFVWDPPWDVNEEVLRTRLLEQAGEDIGENVDEPTDGESESGEQGDESESEDKNEGEREDEGTRDDGGGGDDGSGGDDGGSAGSESDGSGGDDEGPAGDDDGSKGGDDGGEGSDDGSEGGDGPLGGLPDLDTPVIDPRNRIREFVSDDEVTDDE
jgi:hypothetical protein